MTGTGEEAIRLFRRQPQAARLVLADSMLPGMDGLALIRTLRILAPGSTVVATSGLDHEENRDKFAALGVTTILPKPFAPTALLKALRHALGESLARQ